MRLIALLLAFAIFLPAPARADGLDGLERLIAAWLNSPHGDYRSPSFTYWNDQGAVPENCAMCHSETGFLDFLGVGGHTAGQVDHPGTINSVIGCASCHTAEAHALDAVTFPSGVEVAGLGSSATCMVCHQGRQSSDHVEARVAGKPEDEVSADLAFVNIHYAASAATMLGAEARPGYQYAGRSYAGRFMHVPSADTCVACHEPHSTAVETDGCLACHRGVDALRDIRTQHRDFAGTGDRSGGIHSEIIALQGQLLDAIRLYAAEIAGTPIAYASSFPYFFADPSGTGELTPDQITRDNRYQSWTPRLLKAAYNYQVAAKDPGGYVHNPRYMLQILHDSLADLAGVTGLDVSHISRP
ncbi:MAG: polyheme membrane-associated cytochrome C [Natronohydrobacter sp.]|nr:polyheme membrane-associated cytochrome C [Natronohydrobacter sp.]